MPNYSLPPSVFQRACELFPTPFHLYDERGIRETARELNHAFSWCEDYEEYFAVKALPNPAILRILKEERCGLDCSSETELMLAESCGFSGRDIMFSANAMPPEEFTYATKLGGFINLDDITHVPLLEKHGGVPPCVCLRYNPGGDFKIGNAIMGNPGEAKYGMTRAQLSSALRRLKEMGVRSFGLHAFLSSNTTDEWYYPTLARLLFQTAIELYRETGVAIAFINLSGGVGIPYRPEEKKSNMISIGAGVEAVYRDCFTSQGITGVAIKTEMGRYMTAPYGWLVSHAVHSKETYKHYIALDATACNLIRPAMYGSYHEVSVVGKENAPHDTCYDIVGSLCENNDKFAIDRMLPHIDMGDIVVIHDTGAHGFSMGYNYNGRLRSSEILYTESGEFKLIRRAETPADYFATLRGLEPSLDAVIKERE
ncbi:MAG: diaminopimelate decarboxylase [Eubacteriales bacterium]|nr:diaminopimelate decarboxylase [Eubacteriales bacterium]MDD3882688.1 diaminopimelate decarboxylase [Eubacteriales bacterium]MDD4512740.1 diaminopimelate decarboxylase [Eubacteriales bacterium]